jgi:hypothetical protein
MSARLAALAMLLCSMNACGGGSGATCDTNADCASGFCKADGTCSESLLDGGPDNDSGSGSGSADAQSGVCTPNHDGVITAGELPMAAGKMATFRIATDPTWDTAGVADTDGKVTWDLTGALAGDEDREVALDAPAGKWWEDDYAGATYASLLPTSDDLSGVFELTASKLQLAGVVSTTGGTYKTELEYDEPAQVLAIPMQAGTSWSSSSTVTGTLTGNPFATYTESYESHVDKVGTMKTPYGEFPVIRIATDMTQSTGLSTRTFTWVAECFGPVATVTSQLYESSDEFSDPAEIRRLAP